MKTSSTNETEQLLKAIKNRQTELESLTSHMISNAQKHIENEISYNEQQIKEWIGVLENISSLSSSVSKTV
jgi:hypothetical protein